MFRWTELLLMEGVCVMLKRRRCSLLLLLGRCHT
jgi:hypothetical protein